MSEPLFGQEPLEEESQHFDDDNSSQRLGIIESFSLMNFCFKEPCLEQDGPVLYRAST